MDGRFKFRGEVSARASLASVDSRFQDCAPHPRNYLCAGDQCVALDEREQKDERTSPSSREREPSKLKSRR